MSSTDRTRWRPIGKLLVANRGEIAVRVLRTAHGLGMATVAMHSDPDAHAPHVALADEAVRLPGTSPTETYLRVDAIVAAALATGADAVHPGYGFLSENAGFARACEEAGVIFVGPSPQVMAAMASKPRARALMEAAGIPVLPGASVDDDTDLAVAGASIGYPLLVKAAAGGGGRGMRVVRDPGKLATAVASAQREAGAAFGDPTVFLEKYVDDPRHIEVQILGDGHGNVVHLFERECSIQRRHQKIVEECPSPAVDAALRAELGSVAVAAGKAVGYVGAGTVEFVLAPDGGFHFLEVNTRLQVEHPVTEAVTGLDLVEQQLRIAEGEPLSDEVRGAAITGHAIEVRLYAEDPAADFRPTSGTLRSFRIEPAPGLRVDAGVADGSVVGTYYDPLLAKVVAHAPHRHDAARRLARALSHARIHGVVTNRGLAVGLLREPDFLAGRTDTGYLGRHDPATLEATTHDDVAASAVAAVSASQAASRAPGGAGPAHGYRYVSPAPQRTLLAHDGREVVVTSTAGNGEPTFAVDGTPLPPVRVLLSTPEDVHLEVAGVRRVYAVARRGNVIDVDGPDGAVTFEALPRPVDTRSRPVGGSLLAPMPGAVVRVLARIGDPVAAGQPLVLIEAMKMEHRVDAPTAGALVEVRVGPGDQVDTGDVMAVVAAPAGDDPDVDHDTPEGAMVRDRPGASPW